MSTQNSKPSNKRAEENPQVTQSVGEAQKRFVDKQKESISKEAVEAINMIIEVIETLKKKDKEEALKKIEEVLGKLDVLVARDPSLALVPVDVHEQVVDFPGSVLEAIELRETAKGLLVNDKVYKARDILIPLASEIDIYITALPLATYPEAIKAIVPLIEEGKFEEAILLLTEVLNTLVVEKVVLALPILRAEHAINLAYELTKDNDNADKEELKKLLAYAEEQLLLAQVLGYIDDEEFYDEIVKEIEAVRAKLEEENKGTKGIFDLLKEKIKELIARQNKKDRENS